jgi:hypothetical protein
MKKDLQAMSKTLQKLVRQLKKKDPPELVRLRKSGEWQLLFQNSPTPESKSDRVTYGERSSGRVAVFHPHGSAPFRGSLKSKTMGASMKEEHERFPRERLVPAGEEWSSRKIFETVHSYIESQIHFTKRWQSHVVAVWAMGTYLHHNFPCYGHLWLNSLTTHSGKSKLLNVLSVLCYKSSGPQLQPTSAVLFRFPSAVGGTFLIDEVDRLDPNRQNDVISILNHYQKHGSVMRNAPGKNKKYALERFPVYCPKVIAGIENLPVTLQDRCIRIALHRKTSSEKVERFLPEDHERKQPLRNQLDDWSVRKALPILAAYRDRKNLGVPEIEDDRVRDILEPLFAIASVLPESVKRQLIDGACDITKGRKSEESEANPAVASVHVLMNHFPKSKDEWKLRTSKACEMLGEIAGLEDIVKVRAMMRKLGFKPSSQRFDKEVLSGYRISRKELKRLMQRYS